MGVFPAQDGGIALIQVGHRAEPGIGEGQLPTRSVPRHGAKKQCQGLEWATKTFTTDAGQSLKYNFMFNGAS